MVNLQAFMSFACMYIKQARYAKCAWFNAKALLSQHFKFARRLFLDANPHLLRPIIEGSASSSHREPPEARSSCRLVCNQGHNGKLAQPAAVSFSSLRPTCNASRDQPCTSPRQTLYPLAVDCLAGQDQCLFHGAGTSVCKSAIDLHSTMQVNLW